MPLLRRALQSIAPDNERKSLLVLAPAAGLANQIRAVCGCIDSDTRLDCHHIAQAQFLIGLA